MADGWMDEPLSHNVLRSTSLPPLQPTKNPNIISMYIHAAIRLRSFSIHLLSASGLLLVSPYASQQSLVSVFCSLLCWVHGTAVVKTWHIAFWLYDLLWLLLNFVFVFFWFHCSSSSYISLQNLFIPKSDWWWCSSCFEANCTKNKIIWFLFHLWEYIYVCVCFLWFIVATLFLFLRFFLSFVFEMSF